MTRSITLPFAVSSTLTLTEVSTHLADQALADHPGERHVTLLAVSVSNLADDSALQLELPLAAAGDGHAIAGTDAGHLPARPGSPAGSARWAVDHAIDTVRDRYGRAAVGYAAMVFSDVDRVPDEFRELAEREQRGDRL